VDKEKGNGIFQVQDEESPGPRKIQKKKDDNQSQLKAEEGAWAKTNLGRRPNWVMPR